MTICYIPICHSTSHPTNQSFLLIAIISEGLPS